jgi:hypothetical protein
MKSIIHSIQNTWKHNPFKFGCGRGDTAAFRINNHSALDFARTDFLQDSNLGQARLGLNLFDNRFVVFNETLASKALDFSEGMFIVINSMRVKERFWITDE